MDSAVVIACAGLVAFAFVTSGYAWIRVLLPALDARDQIAGSVAVSTVVAAFASGTGLIAPWGFTGHSTVVLSGYVFGGWALLWRRRRSGLVHDLSLTWVLWLPFAVAFAIVTTFGQVQGDPDQTISWPGLFYSARVTNTPADHVLPYRSAQFIQHGFDPATTAYFPDWDFADRPPLAAAVEASVSAAVGIEFPRIAPWELSAEDQRLQPIDPAGYWFYRIIATLLSAAVVLAIARLAWSLWSPRAALLAGLLAAVNPYVLTHTFYTWPKMLAAYLVLLHFTLARERRMPFVAGVLAGLAFLAHPLAGLYVVGSILVIAFRGRRGAASAFGGALLVVLPWQYWTTRYAHPSRLITYPLGSQLGDPNDLGGELTRIWDTFRSAGIGHWINIRWESFVKSVLPLHPRDYCGRCSTTAADWFEIHTLVITGIVCFVVVPIVGVGLVRWWRASRAEPIWMLAIPSLLCLAFWGLDGRGLGNDLLQPMAAVLLAVAGAGLLTLGRRWRTVVVILILAEAASVIWWAFFKAAPGVSPVFVTGAVATWVAGAVMLVVASATCSPIRTAEASDGTTIDGIGNKNRGTRRNGVGNSICQ